MSDDTIIKVELSKNQLTPRQIDLIKQLQLWADDLPIFYKDNLTLINSEEITAKPNVCAHLIRELDSGLRNIFGNLQKHNDYCGCNINGKKETLTDNVEICKHCDKKIRPDNKKQIATMLGRSEEDDLVKRWHKLSSEFFHKFAHRDSETNQIRDVGEFLKIWTEYDNLLQHTFGTHLDSASKLDTLLKNTTPASPVLVAIKKILINEALNHYFYSNLKQLNWLKPLNDADFFNPINNPKPQQTEDGKGYYIISWSIFRYLEWVSSNLPTDDNYVKELVKIIDTIINYRENGNKIKNFRTDFSIYKILTSIPSKFMTKNHITFIRNSLETDFHSGMISAELSRGFIPKLILEDNKDILLYLIEVVCSFVEQNKDIESLLEEYWFAELVKKYKGELSKYAGKEIVEIIICKIKDIKKKDAHSFSVVWIPTIEFHEQKSFPERYESQLIDLLVECLINLDNDEIIKNVTYLLKSEFDIFKRIGFYLISQRFELLNDTLFSLEFNPLEDFNTKHELYNLLKLNANKFHEKQIDILIKWIEEKEYYLDYTKAEDKESVLAYRKKEWYIALLLSKNSSILESYSKYHKINEAVSEHPDFVSWSTSWVGESTPMEEFQIEKSTINELVKIINEFKEENGFRKPTVRGFADVIQRDVEKQPSKYSDALDKFKKVNLAYICSILRGFINISTKNNDEHKLIVKLNWENILSFLNEFIDNSSLEADHTGNFNYNEWFIAEVARLIESGTKLDDTAFDVKLLPIAKEILLKLTKHEFYHPASTEDYVNFTLNSTEGKIQDAMLNYSLRVYRTVDKIFDQDIKEYFNKRIDEKKYLEVFTTLGQYLPQFSTLDKEWINIKFDLIFPKDNDEILYASISGLFFNTTVYSNFYASLKEKGIYKKLLGAWDTNKKSLNKSLLRHICLGYAESWEEIGNNTLIKELLNKYDSLDEVVRFFWIIAKNMKTEYKPRVKYLWKYIAEHNQNKPILGKIIQWLNIFEELDDELVDLCIKGAKHVEGHNAHYVIEYLLKFLDTKYEKVGKILLELVSNIKLVSDYKKEDVLKIVGTLYTNDKKQLADDICNQYFDKQNLIFLRELYAMNNSSTVGGNQK